MKDKGTKKETDTELLARLMAEGFGQVNTRLDGIDARLDGTDARFDGIDYRLLSLEKGQAETHRRLDSIEKKQVGMLESLDETVHQNEFRKLVQRVDILEKQPHAI
jgi:tetrahydromethanopterin S-methyltransferase subunit G